MENYQYIKVPNYLTLSEIIENKYNLAPSKYSRFIPVPNVTYKTLDTLCVESKSNILYRSKTRYYYSEIGDIDVNNGSLRSSQLYGIKLPTENPKKIKSGDILISTVRTYRGGIGYVVDELDNHCCSPAIFVIGDVDKSITKEYLFAVLRTNFFIEQILGFQNRGLYPRLDKNAIKHIWIPIPKNESILKYVTILTKSYFNKITLIRKKHNAILSLIEKELSNNQNNNTFNYELPRINDLENIGRLDSGLYSRKYKENNHLIHNYKNGYSNIYDLGFSLSRGQNLQESNIGISIYSDTHYKHFYSLALPTYFSDYGTIDKIIYLGNKNKLKTLSENEIVFGAEGTFRSIVICDEKENFITNIHGITLYNKNPTLSIFIKCYLDFIVKKGIIDCVKVGGNGGSFAQKYWEIIPFPNFPEPKQKEIAKLYHNSEISYQTKNCTLDNFLDIDNEYNKTAGIYELDKTAKLLKERLNAIIDDIVNGKEVKISFEKLIHQD
jgi:type I restriction enzyme S subunit